MNAPRAFASRVAPLYRRHSHAPAPARWLLIVGVALALVPATGCGVITSIVAGVVALVEGTKSDDAAAVNSPPVVTLTAPLRATGNTINFQPALDLIVVDNDGDNVRMDLFWSTDGSTFTAAASIVGDDTFTGSAVGNQVTMTWDATADLPGAGEYVPQLWLRVDPVQTADGKTGAPRTVGPFEYGNSSPTVSNIVVELNANDGGDVGVEGSTVVRFDVSDNSGDNVSVVRACYRIGAGTPTDLLLPAFGSSSSDDFPGGSFFSLATDSVGVEHNLTWDTSNTIVKTAGVLFCLQVEDKFGAQSTLVDSFVPFSVNNNDPPIVVVEEFFPGFGHPVPLLFSVYEPEGQPVTLEYEFSTDNGQSWAVASEYATERSIGHGPIPTLSPASGVIRPTQMAFFWDISRDAPTSGSVKMRVRATDSLGDSSLDATTPTVASDPELTPAAKPQYLEGLLDASLVLDFDGDGDDDVFTLGHNFGNDDLLFNLFRNVGGLRSLPEPLHNGVGLFPHATVNGQDVVALAHGDFDADGDQDLVFAWHDDSLDLRVAWLENAKQLTGVLKFHQPMGLNAPAIAASNEPVQGLAVADFNGDGFDDILVVADFPVVYYCTVTAGTPVFTRVQVDTSGSGPLAVGDFNSDGRPDFVVANRIDNALHVYQKTAAGGGFNLNDTSPIDGNTVPDPIPGFLGYRPLSLHAADISGDGKTDLVAVMTEDGAASFHQIGGFLVSQGSHDQQFGTPILAAKLLDFSGDGRPDLLIARDGFGTDLTVNTGAGLAGTSARHFGTGSENLVPLDLDGDGLRDFFTGRFRYRHTTRQYFDHDTPGNPEKLVHDQSRLPTLFSDVNETVVAGDFDGNGGDDLLAGPKLWLQAPWGNRLRTQPITGEENQGLLAADLDANGFADMVAVDTVFGETYTVEARDGLLTNPALITDEFAAAAAVVGNFYGHADGRLDVALFNRSGGSYIKIYENTAGGFVDTDIFILPIEFDFAFVEMQALDFDADGNLDIVMFTKLAGGGNQLQVYLQKSPGNFSELAAIDIGADGGAAIGNFLDGAGFEGLEFYAGAQGRIYHRDNNGEPNATAFVVPGGVPMFVDMRVGDVNLDGRDDIFGNAVGDAAGDPLRSFYSAAGNTFTAGPLLSGPLGDVQQFTDAVVADFTADGKPDLLVMAQRNLDPERNALLFANHNANGEIFEPVILSPFPFTELVAPNLFFVEQVIDLNLDGLPDVILRDYAEHIGLMMNSAAGLRGVTDEFNSPTLVVIDFNTDGYPDLDLGTKLHVQIPPASMWNLRWDNVPVGGAGVVGVGLNQIKTGFQMMATRHPMTAAALDTALGLNPPIANALQPLQPAWRFSGDVRLVPTAYDSNADGANDATRYQLLHPTENFFPAPEYIDLRIPLAADIPNDFLRVLAAAGGIRVFRQTTELAINGTASYPESLYGTFNPADPNTGTPPNPTSVLQRTTTTYEFPQTAGNAAFTVADRNVFRIDTATRELHVRSGKSGAIATYASLNLETIAGNRLPITRNSQTIAPAGIARYYKVFTATGDISVTVIDNSAASLDVQIYAAQTGNLLAEDLGNSGSKVVNASLGAAGWVFVRVTGHTPDTASTDFTITISAP